MNGKHIYTGVSGQALLGLQRLLVDRDIYVKPTEHGFTVVTTPSSTEPFQAPQATAAAAQALSGQSTD